MGRVMTKTKAKTKTKAAKPTKRGSKPHAKTAYQTLESAVASTAAFAAGVARDAEEKIRELAFSASGNPETDPAPRPTEMLTRHHRNIEKLFGRLESANGYTDATLRALADDLTAHIAIEEKLFYPAVRKANPDLILEGLEEHAMGRFALMRLLGTPSSDHSLKARLKALKELMTNHHKEEENDLFPKARKMMSKEAQHELGRAMRTRFDADVKRGHEAVLATFHDQLRKPVRGKTPRSARAD